MPEPTTLRDFDRCGRCSGFRWCHGENVEGGESGYSATESALAERDRLRAGRE